MTICAVQVKNRRHDAFTASTRKLAISKLEDETTELGLVAKPCRRHDVPPIQSIQIFIRWAVQYLAAWESPSPSISVEGSGQQKVAKPCLC